MSEIVTLAQLDVRELDCQPLGTIAGCAYYEVRQIVRDDGHTREIIGRASDWPIISRDARIAALEQRIAELEAAAVRPAPAIVPIDPPPPDDGLAPCDWPGCADRVKPRGLGAHKRRKHGALVPPTAGDPPALPPIVHIESPWRCATCASTTHTQSLSDPTRCMRCAADKLTQTNGHTVAGKEQI